MRRGGPRVKPWRRGKARQCGRRIREQGSVLLPAGVLSQPATQQGLEAITSSRDGALLLLRLLSLMLQPLLLSLLYLLQERGPTLFCRSAGGKKSRKDAGRKRAAEKKKKKITCCRQSALLSSSLFPPPPSALAAPPSSAQHQNLGPRWVPVPGLYRLAVFTLVTYFPSGELRLLL